MVFLSNNSTYVPERECFLGVNVGSIGEFVRNRRKAAKMTQQALGELAGVGTRFISELERGKTTVRMLEVETVLAVFGKTLGVVDHDRIVEELDDE